MNEQLKHFSFSILIISGLLFASCEQSMNKPDSIDHDEIAQEAIEDYESYRLRINLMDSSVFEFPSPVELAQSYKASGIKFIPGITNPAENLDQYHTMVKKALNFGVYSADLSYCVMNDQGQCSSDYIIALQSLSERIGLSEIFKYELILTEFNKSIGQKDSMKQLIKGIQRDLDNTLHRDGAQDKAILFYTGAWVESAYIASNAPANFSNNVDTATLNQLSEQMSLLNSITDEIEKIEDKTIEINELIEKIDNFRKATASIRITSKNDSIVINPMDLKTIKDEIYNLRTFLVS